MGDLTPLPRNSRAAAVHTWRLDATGWQLVREHLVLATATDAALPPVLAPTTSSHEITATRERLARHAILVDGRVDQRLAAAVRLAGGSPRVGIVRRHRGGSTVAIWGLAGEVVAAMSSTTRPDGSTIVDVQVLAIDGLLDQVLHTAALSPEPASAAPRRHDRRGVWPLLALADTSAVPASLARAFGADGRSADSVTIDVIADSWRDALIIVGAPGERWSVKTDGQQLAAEPVDLATIRRWLLLRLSAQLGGDAWAA